jgi:uncharacterized membrane protein
MSKFFSSRLFNQFCAGCLLIQSIFVPSPVLAAQRSQPKVVVYAVLFYSPYCDHCHYVITETLPPLYEQYGEQLQILAVDTTQEAGYYLFVATLQKFNLERGGVPFMVIGDQYLVGSADIPAQFPGLVADHLALGGIGWPEIPGLGEYLASINSTQTAEPTSTPEPPTPTVMVTSSPFPTLTATPYILVPTGNDVLSLEERIARDPLGNGLAIVVLVGMIAALFAGGWYFHRSRGSKMTTAVRWIIPALCVIGLGVAGYLAYVETQQVEAICGPVGDCNMVQQSEYARLFRILPIGVLGMLGYVVILAAWFTSLKSKGSLADYGTLAMLAMTVIGTIFSVYLTFLEPFVIGATCAWCLTSAGIMTALFLFSLESGKQAFYSLLARSTSGKRRASRK